MIKKIVLLILLLIPVNAWSANIYVDATCAAGAAYDTTTRTQGGGSSTSYQTIAAAVAAMSSGDDIYIRGGTYNEIQINLNGIDGTAENYCSMQSYPGEWAIIDGQHGGSGTQRSVIYSMNHALQYWKFERLEITGGGHASDSLTYGAGLCLEGATYVEIRYCYIHDNYQSTVTTGSSGGIMLENDPYRAQHCTIEYNYLTNNGNLIGDRNCQNAQIALFTDYVHNAATVTYPLAYNEIRYNLMDCVASDSSYTNTGIAIKSYQRLTGHYHGDNEDPTDLAPNDGAWYDRGDKYHHNIILNAKVGFRAGQDYCQIYNNIVDLDDHGLELSGNFGGVVAPDLGTDERGPFWICVYNNTIIGDGGRGIGYKWAFQALEIYDHMEDFYIFNNIITNHGNGYYQSGIAVTSMEGSGGAEHYTWNKMHLWRNFFYTSLTPCYLICETRYTPAQLIAGGADSDYSWQKSTPTPFAGESGANQYIATGSYDLDGTYTIATGGIGGAHPYLSGVTIPSYVGAVNPSDSDWVAGTLGLATDSNEDGIPDNLLSATAGSDPTWIEGSGSSPSTPTSFGCVQSGTSW